MSNNPHLAAITESHHSNKETLNIWCSKNRNENGGVGFLIRNDIRNLIEEYETNVTANTKSKWVILKGKINIAMMYGKQESDSRDDVEKQFQNLTTEINGLQRKHHIIIIDLNAKVEINKPECRPSMSRNGRILNDLVENTNTIIVNTT
jgi:hypothetical protein